MIFFHQIQQIKSEFAERRKNSGTFATNTSSPRTIVFFGFTQNHRNRSKWQTMIAMQHLVARNVADSIYEKSDTIEHEHLHIGCTVLLAQIVEIA